MKLKIEIKMDNAAFEDNQGDECARILKLVVATIESNPHLGGLALMLQDVNGNRVGDAWVTK